MTTSSCSGVCREGYYCPERSVSDAHQSCGAVHVFCPRGSALPTQVSPGHYTTGGNSAHQDQDDGTANGANHYGDDDEYTRTAQRLCQPGYYCGAVNGNSNAQPGGIRRNCPPGTYGSQYGLDTVQCSGSCPKGHYCPVRTIKPTNCPAGTFGSVGDSNRKRNVTWTGDNVIELASVLNVVVIAVGLDEARCSGDCALGHYCPAASTVVTQIQCPAGRYGNVTGLRTSECSPQCSGRFQSGSTFLYFFTVSQKSMTSVEKIDLSCSLLFILFYSSSFRVAFRVALLQVLQMPVRLWEMCTASLHFQILTNVQPGTLRCAKLGTTAPLVPLLPPCIHAVGLRCIAHVHLRYPPPFR